MDASRVWVITGVNAGLGLALALHVASQGEKVIGTVRSPSKFPQQLREAGVQLLAVDLSGSDEQVEKAGEAALHIFGHVDVLVNNAAYGVFGPIEELQVSDFRAQFQTNLFGLIAFTQPFITHFRTRRTGHILNISSMAGWLPLPSMGAYCATKAALNSLTDTLSLELKLFGVRVLSIMPGYFSTQFFIRNQESGSSQAAEERPAETGGSQAKLSKVYTDPETQGYDQAYLFPRRQIEKSQIGDPEKYAQRVYEVVTGTGLGKDVVARSTVDGTWEGPWEFDRVPIGTDSYALLKQRWDIWGENLRAFEPIANSTDVEAERLQYFPRG